MLMCKLRVTVHLRERQRINDEQINIETQKHQALESARKYRKKRKETQAKPIKYTAV